MLRISNSEQLRIKREASYKIGCKITECILYRAGVKGGRPNWELEVIENGKRFAFTAFDSEDIDGMHEVVAVY